MSRTPFRKPFRWLWIVLLPSLITRAILTGVAYLTLWAVASGDTSKPLRPYTYRNDSTIYSGKNETVRNRWKLSTPLFEGQQQHTGTRDFTIAVTSIDSFKLWLKEKGRNIKWIGQNAELSTILVRTSSSDGFSQLLESPFVIYIDRGGRKPKEETWLDGMDLSLNRITAAHRYFPHIRGNGLNVSIKEESFDTTDIDFRLRYFHTSRTSRQASMHATIMATLVGGAGNSGTNGRGVAPGSRLSSASFSNLSADPDSFFTRHSISVQNHSYGVAIENYYGLDAFSYDRSTAQQPNLVHVFSSGNSGLSASADGAYRDISGFANLTGNFKMAKNVIVAAAVDSFGQELTYISGGPAYDGRLKPELSAFTVGGSSGAAAIVSGSALQVQQVYKEKLGQLPASALVKALLVNTADDAGPPGIDFKTGYGSVNLLKALRATDQGRFLSGTVSNNETATFSITVPADIARLKTTLVWNDPPAKLNDPIALVHDLDLTLIRLQDGQQWLPWVLNSKPHPDSLRLPAVRKKDDLNNTEQVSIELPAAGTYQIRVKGSKVLSPQAFYLAYEMEKKDSFWWDNPVRTEGFTARTQTLLRWQSTFNTATGTLHWTAGGNNWQLISAATDLRKNYGYWTVPDTVTTAVLRMTIGSQQFYSDTFTISRVLQINSQFECSDSARLVWNKERGTVSYRLYALKGTYLEPVAQTSDSTYPLDATLAASSWFALAPILMNQKEGQISRTYFYPDAEAFCYIKNFSAVPDGQDAVVSFTLQSLERITKIFIEKEGASSFVPVKEFSPGNLSQNYVEQNIGKGIHRYRIKLLLKNGQTVLSEPESVYFFGSDNYLVFPNPVMTGSCTILQQGMDNSMFRLFSIDGRMVREKRLTETHTTVDLQRLPAGVYVYEIRTTTARQTGKLIVH